MGEDVGSRSGYAAVGIGEFHPLHRGTCRPAVSDGDLSFAGCGGRSDGLDANLQWHLLAPGGANGENATGELGERGLFHRKRGWESNAVSLA